MTAKTKEDGISHSHHDNFDTNDDSDHDNNHHPNTTNNQAQQVLADYIQAGVPPPDSWERVYCCNSSRYLYCEICCRLLVPSTDMPAAIKDGDIQLPFKVHILLDDRRASSTGVQVQSIYQAMTQNSDESENTVQLLDIDRGEVPDYDKAQQPGTYLLFPGEDSVPLSTVLNNKNDDNPPLTTLVLLDCKWGRSRLFPLVENLPQVHLDHPPDSSFFWRWHNTGPGRVSTIEALYYAAWQITSNMHGWSLENQQQLVHWLWLFRLQRSLIESKYRDNQVRGFNPHVPFTEQAKEFSRKLRQQKVKN